MFRCDSTPRKIAARSAIALAVAAIALWSPPAGAQSPAYGLGRPPTAEEVRALDITVGPDGRELPPGSGTAAAGKAIYAARCALCHGATGKEGPHDVLVGGAGTLATARPVKTVGSYWPYATTLWDYLNRSMPFDRPGTLPPDQVYATVAYLLFLNGLVRENDVVDAKTLLRIRMPNRDGFVPDPRPDIGTDHGIKEKKKTSSARRP